MQRVVANAEKGINFILYAKPAYDQHVIAAWVCGSLKHWLTFFSFERYFGVVFFNTLGLFSLP